ncbi:MAG: DNA translocase FtsK 4TM domain-containing protein, partial [Pseudonocardiaceae bacterium]
MTGAWNLLARGAGGLARAVGRTRELEPEHRRDGLALILVSFAVVAGAGMWWAAGGPVGAGVQQALRATFGSAAMVLPVLLAAVAVTLMRTEPDAAARPRRTLGTVLLMLGILGIWHLLAGAPADGVGRSHAAGAVGFLIADPLADGFTHWVATPLLVLLALYGLLVLTGTPVRAVPDRIRRLFGMQTSQDEFPHESDVTTTADSTVTEAEPATERLRRPSRRRQATQPLPISPEENAPEENVPPQAARPAAKVKAAVLPSAAGSV